MLNIDMYGKISKGYDWHIPHAQGTKLSAGLWTSNPVHMPKASLIKYSHVESYQQRQHGLFSKGKKSNRYLYSWSSSKAIQVFSVKWGKKLNHNFQQPFSLYLSLDKCA